MSPVYHMGPYLSDQIHHEGDPADHDISAGTPAAMNHKHDIPPNANEPRGKRVQGNCQLMLVILVIRFQEIHDWNFNLFEYVIHILVL